MNRENYSGRYDFVYIHGVNEVYVHGVILSTWRNLYIRFDTRERVKRLP